MTVYTVTAHRTLRCVDMASGLTPLAESSPSPRTQRSARPQTGRPRDADTHETELAGLFWPIRCPFDPVREISGPLQHVVRWGEATDAARGPPAVTGPERDTGLRSGRAGCAAR